MKRLQRDQEKELRRSSPAPVRLDAMAHGTPRGSPRRTARRNDCRAHMLLDRLEVNSAAVRSVDMSSTMPSLACAFASAYHRLTTTFQAAATMSFALPLAASHFANGGRTATACFAPPILRAAIEKILKRRYAGSVNLDAVVDLLGPDS